MHVAHKLDSGLVAGSFHDSLHSGQNVASQLCSHPAHGCLFFHAFQKPSIGLIISVPQLIWKLLPGCRRGFG